MVAKYLDKLAEASRSSLRHSSPTHAVNQMFALFEENRIVAFGPGPEALNRERRVDHKPRSGLFPRLVEPAEVCQRRCKEETADRRISISLDGSAQPNDRLCIGAEM
jgi:hypothetical protein